MKVIAFNKRNDVNSFSTQFRIFPTDEGLQKYVEDRAMAGYTVHIFTYSESVRLDNNIININIEKG